MAAVTSLPIAILSSFFWASTLIEAVYSIGTFVGILLFTLTIEWFLLRNSELASIKRIAGITAFSNGLWLFLVLVGSAGGFVVGDQVYYRAVGLGMLIAIAFRLLIYRSIFLESMSTALPMAFLQPLALGLSLPPPLSIFGTLALNPTIVAGGVTVLGLTFAFLRLVDGYKENGFSEPPLSLLKAFMHAWAENNPHPLEARFEARASEKELETSILTLNSDGRGVSLVLPEVHPGPIHPIGSSNLPYQVFKALGESGSGVMIFHGVSDHSSDLPSQKQMDRFLSSLPNAKVISSGAEFSGPVTKSVNGTTATALAFGDIAMVTLTFSPHGADDIPAEAGGRIRSVGSTLGFKDVLVIDCHNSHGPRPNLEMCDDAVEAARSALQELKSMSKSRFKIGYAHSSSLNVQLGIDVGPAGLSVLALESNSSSFVLVSVDANNAVLGLREELMNSLAGFSILVLEIATTDTHVTAARASNPKGYYALGELTTHAELVEVLRALCGKALDDLKTAEFSFKVAKAKLGTIGEDVFEDFSKLMDRSLRVAKRTTLIVAAVTLLTLFSAFLI